MKYKGFPLPVAWFSFVVLLVNHKIQKTFILEIHDDNIIRGVAYILCKFIKHIFFLLNVFLFLLQ